MPICLARQQPELPDWTTSGFGAVGPPRRPRATDPTCPIDPLELPCAGIGFSPSLARCSASGSARQKRSARSAISSRRESPVVLAVKRVRAAVVNINGEKLGHASGDEYSPYESDRPVNGMGTGVVIDPRGYVITNHHVVEGVRQIRVTMSDGKTHRGHVGLARSRDRSGGDQD